MKFINIPDFPGFPIPVYEITDSQFGTKRDWNNVDIVVKDFAPKLPWWTVGAEVQLVPSEDWFVWLAVFPDKSQRALAVAGDVPTSIIAKIKENKPFSLA